MSKLDKLSEHNNVSIDRMEMKGNGHLPSICGCSGKLDYHRDKDKYITVLKCRICGKIFFLD